MDDTKKSDENIRCTSLDACVASYLQAWHDRPTGQQSSVVLIHDAYALAAPLLEGLINAFKGKK